MSFYSIWTQKITIFYNRFRTDRLLSNSIYLMLTTFIMSVTGFVFWIVNAKFHSPQEIGLATTFISITTLITNFSMLGLNTAIVRFLPKSIKKNELINTTFSILLIISFFFSIIFILGISHFSPNLKPILQSPTAIILFLLFIPIASVNMITDSVFISYGKAIYTLMINTVMSISKVLLAVLLISWGVVGIISSFAISTIIALVASILFMIFKLNYAPSFRIHYEKVQEMWRFSLGNYLSGLLGTTVAMIMPVIITSKLSPEITAYYYMPSMIVSLLLSIPRSTVSSLIAEGSREEESLQRLALKSFLHAYSILIPACIVIFLFGNLILSAFGKSYSSEGLLYLRLLTIAIIFSVPGFISGGILNIKKQVGIQIFINIIGAILSLGLNLFFLSKGLYGLGIAAILFQVFITFFYLLAIYWVKNK